MLEGFKSILSRVEKRIDEIREKTPSSLDTLTRSSTEIVQNVKSGFEELATTSKDTLERWVSLPFGAITPNLYKDGVNLAAGCELACVHQEYMHSIHHNTIILSDRARAAYKTLYNYTLHCEQLEEQWKQLATQFTELRELTNTIQDIHLRLGKICEQIEIMEKQLDEELEATAAAQLTLSKKYLDDQLEKRKRELEHDLVNLENKLQKEAKIASEGKRNKARLINEHLERAVEEEAERIREQLEKQAQQDMLNYVIYGGFGNKSQQQPQAEELDSALSATAPPLGTDALDEFFNFSSDSTPEPTTATGLSDDDDQEGPAIEILKVEESPLNEKE